MSATLWGPRPLPDVGPGTTTRWSWSLHAVADVTAARGRLRAELPRRAGAIRRDDLERVLLAFEELASNGLRHGTGPVHAVVAAGPSGWLVDVTDAAPDRGPTPAIGRDPAEGGLGLYLVARLGTAHGWCVRDGRKHVWVHLRPSGESVAVPRAAADRDRQRAG